MNRTGLHLLHFCEAEYINYNSILQQKYKEKKVIHLSIYLITKSVFFLSYRDAGISAVAFHPSRQMAVSASYRGDFKVGFKK